MMKRVMQNTDPLLGRPVGSLQTMLRLLSQGDSAIAPVAPDGIFGRCTLRSVTDFQRAFSLPVTGTVDDAIWRALVAAYDTARVRQDAAAPLLIYLGPDAAISDDENAQHIPLLQALLHTLHQCYAALPPVALSGRYDAQTQTAVAALQRMAGLQPDGVTGKQTWRFLTALYRSATRTAPAPRL